MRKRALLLSIIAAGSVGAAAFGWVTIRRGFSARDNPSIVEKRLICHFQSSVSAVASQDASGRSKAKARRTISSPPTFTALLMDALLRIGTSIHTPGNRVQRSAQFGLSPGLSDRLGGDSKFRYPARQWSQNYVSSASRLRTPRPKPGGSLTR